MIGNISKSKKGLGNYEIDGFITDKDFATNENPGIVKCNPEKGIEVDSFSRELKIVKASNEQIDKGEDEFSPIVPANLEHAVKSVGDKYYAQKGESIADNGKKYATFVIGTSTAGHTDSECDYLCDGKDDHLTINDALNALPPEGGKIVFLTGVYYVKEIIGTYECIKSTNSGNIILEGNCSTFVEQTRDEDDWGDNYNFMQFPNAKSVKITDFNFNLDNALALDIVTANNLYMENTNIDCNSNSFVSVTGKLDIIGGKFNGAISTMINGGDYCNITDLILESGVILVGNYSNVMHCIVTNGDMNGVIAVGDYSKICNCIVTAFDYALGFGDKCVISGNTINSACIVGYDYVEDVRNGCIISDNICSNDLISIYGGTSVADSIISNNIGNMDFSYNPNAKNNLVIGNITYQEITNDPALNNSLVNNMVKGGAVAEVVYNNLLEKRLDGEA